MLEEHIVVTLPGRIDINSTHDGRKFALHMITKAATCKTAFMSGSKSCPRCSCLDDRDEGMQFSKLKAIWLEDVLLLCMPLIPDKMINIT